LKGVFHFECAVGLLLGATGGHKHPERQAALERAKDDLRKHYESFFTVSLSAAPSVLPVDQAKSAPQLAQTEKRSEPAQQTIIRLLGEPLSRKVSRDLPRTLAAAPKPGAGFADRPVPRLRLESPTVFEESIIGLGGWLRSRWKQEPTACSTCANQWVSPLVELRALAEEDNLATALEKASVLLPALRTTEKQALAPFFAELSWALLQAIERHLAQGAREKAVALTETAKAIIKETPSRDDFEGLLRELFAAEAASRGSAPPSPFTAPSPLQPPGRKAQQAEALLRDYADELNMPENHLELEFLLAVRRGSEGAFKRKEKLRNRLQRSTRWGGREPYKTTLRLLEFVKECS
jgi:hypothetical protein